MSIIHHTPASTAAVAEASHQLLAGLLEFARDPAGLLYQTVEALLRSIDNDLAAAEDAYSVIGPTVIEIRVRTALELL